MTMDTPPEVMGPAGRMQFRSSRLPAGLLNDRLS